jgi:hypothetical protein
LHIEKSLIDLREELRPGKINLIIERGSCKECPIKPESI